MVKKITFENSIIVTFAFFLIAFVIIYMLYPKPLWIDECALGYNIITKSFKELLLPLDYLQVAPIGYLYLTKLSGVWGNYSDFSLRLPNIFALLLLYYLLFVTIKNFGLSFFHIIIPVLVCKSLPHYGFEHKQYIFDALGLMYFYFLISTYYKSEKNFLENWKTLPVIFALSFTSNISLALFPLLIGLFTMISFNWKLSTIPVRIYIYNISIVLFTAVYYFIFIKDHPHRTGMIDYWENQMISLNNLNLTLILKLFISAVNFHIVDFIWLPSKFNIISKLVIGCLLFLPFILLIFKIPRLLFIFSIIPFIFAILLASLKLYPLDGGRLSLYLIIPVLLIASFGIKYFFNKLFNNKPILILVFGFLMILFFSNILFSNILNPKEDFRSILEQSVKDKTFLLVVGSANKSYKYYASQYAHQKRSMPGTRVIMSRNLNDIIDGIEEIKKQGNQRLTIVSVHKSVLMSTFSSSKKWKQFLKTNNIQYTNLNFYFDNRRSIWFSNLYLQ